jgi:RHS repeat-associated protein
VGTTEYDSYGNRTNHTGTADTAIGYSGNWTDPYTGLVYLRARDYDPSTAQFLTVDPQVDTTRQPYAYVADDPLDSTDSSGLAPCSTGYDWQSCASTASLGFLAPAQKESAASQNLDCELATLEENGYAQSPLRGTILGQIYLDEHDFQQTYSGGIAATGGLLGVAGGLSSPGAATGDDAPFATPAGKPLSAHYLFETGPGRNIPGSVVDETIEHGIPTNLGDRTLFYDPKNNMTVVLSNITGKIMSARKGDLP